MSEELSAEDWKEMADACLGKADTWTRGGDKERVVAWRRRAAYCAAQAKRVGEMAT